MIERSTIKVETKGEPLSRYLPRAVRLVHDLRFEIDFNPEDSWTFWQRSSAKRENSKSS